MSDSHALAQGEVFSSGYDICHTLDDMNESRINARVGEATQRQMEELVRATGQTTSDVVPRGAADGSITYVRTLTIAYSEQSAEIITPMTVHRRIGTLVNEKIPFIA